MTSLLLQYKRFIEAGKYNAAKSIENQIMAKLETSKYKNFQTRDRVIETLTYYSI